MFDPQLATGLGCCAAIFLCCTGTAIASSHAGIYALRRRGGGKGLKMLDFVPMMQAGVLSLYGTVIGILLCRRRDDVAAAGGSAATATGHKNLSAGLVVGLACWTSGYGMASFLRQVNEEERGQEGIGATGVEETPSPPSTPTEEQRQPLLKDTKAATAPACDTRNKNKKLILAMIFLEAVGLYGFVMALFLIYSK